MIAGLKCYHEPVPAYMQRLLMLGARFVEGNTGEGAGGSGEPQSPSEPPVEPEKDDEQLGEGGLKALKAERDAREKAEKDLKAAQKKIADLEAATQSTNGDGDDETPPVEPSAPSAPEPNLELVRLQAIIDHPGIPKEYHHLVKGDSKEELEASAKAISELATRPGVVHQSGTGGDSQPGSISEYRRQIADRNKK